MLNDYINYEFIHREQNFVATCHLYIIHHYICTKETKNIYLIFNPIYPKSPVNV